MSTMENNTKNVGLSCNHPPTEFYDIPSKLLEYSIMIDFGFESRYASHHLDVMT